MFVIFIINNEHSLLTVIIFANILCNFKGSSVKLLLLHPFYR